MKAKPCTACHGRGEARRGVRCLLCAGTGRASGRGLDSRTAAARAAWLLSDEGRAAAAAAAELRAAEEARAAEDREHAFGLVADVFAAFDAPAERAVALARVCAALQTMGSEGAALVLEACHEELAEAGRAAGVQAPGPSSPESTSAGTRPDGRGKGAHGATAASGSARPSGPRPGDGAARPSAHRAVSGPSAGGAE